MRGEYALEKTLARKGFGSHIGDAKRGHAIQDPPIAHRGEYHHRNVLQVAVLAHQRQASVTAAPRDGGVDDEQVPVIAAQFPKTR